MFLNVLPYFSPNDVTDKRLGHFELFGYFGLSLPTFKKLSNYFNFRHIKLCVYISRSEAVRDIMVRFLPPFFVRISEIVALSSQKKMGRSNTASNVALMKDIKSAGNAAFKNHPRSSMGTLSFPKKIKDAVAIIIEGSGPTPTRISFENFIQKTFHTKAVEGF